MKGLDETARELIGLSERFGVPYAIMLIWSLGMDNPSETVALQLPVADQSWFGLCSIVSIAATMYVAFVCQCEVGGAISSGCANCRGFALTSIYQHIPMAVGIAVAASMLTAKISRNEYRVARSSAAVSLGIWMISVGFVRGWW